MAPGQSAYATVVRVEPGPGTGDTVYVIDRGWYTERIVEPVGTRRVEVVEGSKFGPSKVRILR
jgi:multidrug efflux pump subunit AcrA (membrane-fusion protein)